MHKKGARSFSDAAVTWEHHTPGIVSDAVKTNRGMTVLVKSQVPTNVADKFSGRWGNKGVVSIILPDDQMLQDRDGNHSQRFVR